MPTVTFPISYTQIPCIVGTPIKDYAISGSYFGGNCIENLTETSFIPRQADTAGGIKAGSIRYISVGW